MKRLPLWSAVLPLLFVGSAGAESTIELTIVGGKVDRANVPVCVPLSLPRDLARFEAGILKIKGESQICQLTEPGIMREGIAPSGKDLIRRDLHFILGNLKAGARLSVTATFNMNWGYSGRFVYSWKDVKGDHADLSTGGKPILRYMYKALDDSTKESREQTYKVYHHLYDPDGKRLVTKGPGGLYTHHRGIFYGFKTVHYGEHKKPVDTWHCTGDTYLGQNKIMSFEGGQVLGRHRVLIDWHGHKKEVFAQEERELTVYNVPGGTLVEFASRLRTTGGPVKLDGDPQHAGFQFRAAQEVAAKTAKQTYYLRPDGAGKHGETRNWPQDKLNVNLPWNAMSFVVDGQRYTVAYLDKPTNPKEARFSERDYGRFGSYFVYELTKAKPLVVNYRLWLQKGEMKGPQVAAMSADFVTPVEVKLSRGS